MIFKFFEDGADDVVEPDDLSATVKIIQFVLDDKTEYKTETVWLKPFMKKCVLSFSGRLGKEFIGYMTQRMEQELQRRGMVPYTEGVFVDFEEGSYCGGPFLLCKGDYCKPVVFVGWGFVGAEVHAGGVEQYSYDEGYVKKIDKKKAQRIHNERYDWECDYAKSTLR